MRSLLAGLLLLLLATSAVAQEERALWVTRYDYQSADDVREIFANAARIGVTRVLFQVRGNASVCYPSQLEPWREDLDSEGGAEGPGFDPLGLAVAQAQRWEIRLEAWINVMPLWKGTGAPKRERHPYRRHPEWVVVGSDGQPQRKSRHYVCANPARADVRAHVAAVAAEIAGSYAVDGVHLDYIRYVLDLEHKLDFSRDPVSLKAFGQDPEQAPAAWARFKAEQVTQTVREIRAAVRKANPRARLTAAVFPTRESRAKVHQDVECWVKEGLIDALYPMTYADDDAEFERRLRESVPLGRAAQRDPPDPVLSDPTIPVVPGVAVFRHSDPRQTLRQIQAVRAHPSAGFALFCYASFFRSADRAELATADARLRRARIEALAQLAPQGQLAEVERLIELDREGGLVEQDELAAAVASVGTRALPLLRARLGQGRNLSFAPLLGLVGGGAEASLLRARCGGDDRVSRRRFAAGLQALTRDPQGVVPVLVACLEEAPDALRDRPQLFAALARYAPRSAAARAALVRLGDEAAVVAARSGAGCALLPQLLACAAPAHPEAPAAVAALARLASPPLQPLLRAVLRAHPEARVRRAALSGRGVPDLELLELALGDPDPAVRELALRRLPGLVRTPYPQAPSRAVASRLLRDPQLRREIRSLVEDPSPGVARVARRWSKRLRTLRPEPLPPARLAAALASVRSGTLAERAGALARLSSLGPAAQAAGAALEGIAREHGLPAELRPSLLRALGQVGDPARAPYLARALAAPELAMDARLQAAAALGRLAEVGASDAVAAICSQLDAAPPRLASVLCDALHGVAPAASAALPALRRALRERRSWRDRALLLLEAMGPSAAPALPELVQCLGAASPYERRLALQALRRLGPLAAPALPRVAALLEEPYVAEEVRWACLDALEAIPATETWRASQGALRRLLKACGQ